MKPIEQLRQLKLAKTRELYPNVPEIALPKTEYNDRSANGLTKCVLDFLNLSGHFCERTGNEGRVIDNRKTYTDVIGRQKTIGTVKRIKSSGTKGTSDLKAVINGRMIAIEIKYGKDRQSEAQKDYQAMVERAGGEYWIVKNFEQFFDLYQEFKSKLLDLNK
jgi:hypothetical protein